MNTVSLEDICDIIIGRTPARAEPSYWGAGHPWLSIADMGKEKELSVTKETITDVAVAECNCKLIPTGTVLLSFKLSIGKIGIAGVPIFTNEAIAALQIRDKRRVLTGYLYHALKSMNLSRGSNRAVMGATLNKHSLESIRIPLPPLDEQRRIAAILDKADAIRRKRQEAGKIASSFAQSLFLDLIGDPISNPKKWKMVPLEEVATTTSGGTPNRKVDGYYGGDIPWVKSGELSQGVVTATEETLTQSGLSESSAKIMSAGTVLIAMYGATAGLVAMLGIEAATNQAVCCIRPGKHIHAEYLLHLLRRHSVSLLTKRVGGAQPNLSQDIIRNLKIPIPPMNVQMDFVQKVACVSHLQRHQESALKETGSLFGAIQGEFF